MKRFAFLFGFILIVLIPLPLLAANHSPTTGAPAPLQQEIPAILSFTADISEIALADAEAGTETATFAWSTTGVGDDQRILIFAYEISTWVLLIDPEGEPLPASGEIELPVRHPVNFNPPSYRLLIVDAEERALSERVLTIPYADSDLENEPSITSFVTTTTSIEADELGYGNPAVEVSWEITDRTPTSNIVFEQAIGENEFVSVELPRANLWVSSAGAGAVQPVYPDGGESVVLRMRIVDLADGSTLDEGAAVIPITGTLSTPTPLPPTAEPVAQQPQENTNTENNNNSDTNTNTNSGGNPPPVSSAGAGGGFELGGHISSFAAVDTARSAGMNWVKKQVRWRRGEGVGAAASVIDGARANGFKVMLGIVGFRDEMGDFDNYINEFAAYLGQVAALGPDAIEVWNEPNIDREWPAGTISGANYTRMLSVAYNAIKTANPSVIVISGAPAPTGFFGGTCQGAGCDDNVFLRQMANAGAANYMDCVGAHYNEGIIGPDQRSGDPRGGHYSRYFFGMLDLYHNAFGGRRPVCWTELGYLSGEGYPPLPGGFAWAGNTTVAQHAEWLGRAAALSRQSGRVRIMIVWNVDFQVYDSDPQGGYAIRRPDGSCPACGTLAAAVQ